MSLQIDGYEVGEILAQSQTGILFDAKATLLGRRVLIRAMPEAAAESEELRKRFLREIRLMGQLSHPHLIAALNAGCQDGRYYLVLEFVDGLDLARRVREQGTLSQDAAMDHVLQAAKGLGYLHRQGVIHRNVKPANLLVDETGHLRVTNLVAAGLAPDSESDIGDAEGLTQQRQIIGTAEYMAPEQAFDAHAADARSDIYSLGCTLYYLLNGQPPYPESDPHKRVAAHTQRPIPSLRKTRLDLSAELDAIFHKMVAKMPVDRYQSMAEVIDALTQVQHELATRAPAKRDWLSTLVLVAVSCAVTIALTTTALHMVFKYPAR